MIGQSDSSGHNSAMLETAESSSSSTCTMGFAPGGSDPNVFPSMKLSIFSMDSRDLPEQSIRYQLYGMKNHPFYRLSGCGPPARRIIARRETGSGIDPRSLDQLQTRIVENRSGRAWIRRVMQGQGLHRIAKAEHRFDMPSKALAENSIEERGSGCVEISRAMAERCREMQRDAEAVT